MIRQHLDPLSKRQNMPADAGSKQEAGPQSGAPSRQGDLKALRMDLEAVIAALDAFVDRPDRSDNFSDLDARLGDAERQRWMPTGEPAMASTTTPQGARLQDQDAREPEPAMTAREPEPGAFAGEVPAEHMRPDFSP